MTPEQVQQIIDLITTIGGQLATAGFALAVRQVIIESSVWLGFSVVLMVAVHIGISHLRAFAYRKENDRYTMYDQSDRDQTIVLSWVFESLIWLFSAFMFVSNLVQLLNPQWYAVERLLKLVQ